MGWTPLFGSALYLYPTREQLVELDTILIIILQFKINLTISLCSLSQQQMAGPTRDGRAGKVSPPVTLPSQPKSESSTYVPGVEACKDEAACGKTPRLRNSRDVMLLAVGQDPRSVLQDSNLSVCWEANEISGPCKPNPWPAFGHRRFVPSHPR